MKQTAGVILLCLTGFAGQKAPTVFLFPCFYNVLGSLKAILFCGRQAMAKGKSDKDYDFELQLKEAEKAEKLLERILSPDQGTTFELKTERLKWHDTGNLVVEYESHDKPSGIAATKADFWVHELRSREDQTLVYLMFPTPVLRKICNDLMEEGTHWRRGGEKKQMEMLVVSLESLLMRLRHFTGPGDERFLTRKERKANGAKKA
jgi:hypothetical protein